jgi:hypothetical protein
MIRSTANRKLSIPLFMMKPFMLIFTTPHSLHPHGFFPLVTLLISSTFRLFSIILIIMYLAYSSFPSSGHRLKCSSLSHSFSFHPHGYLFWRFCSCSFSLSFSSSSWLFDLSFSFLFYPTHLLHAHFSILFVILLFMSFF